MALTQTKPTTMDKGKHSSATTFPAPTPLLLNTFSGFTTATLLLTMAPPAHYPLSLAVRSRNPAGSAPTSMRPPVNTRAERLTNELDPSFSNGLLNIDLPSDKTVSYNQQSTMNEFIRVANVGWGPGLELFNVSPWVRGRAMSLVTMKRPFLEIARTGTPKLPDSEIVHLQEPVIQKSITYGDMAALCAVLVSQESHYMLFIPGWLTNRQTNVQAQRPVLQHTSCGGPDDNGTVWMKFHKVRCVLTAFCVNSKVLTASTGAIAGGN